MRAIMCLTLIWRESQFQFFHQSPFTKAKTNSVAGSMQMNMQTKPQYLHILATWASPPTSLQHSGWTAT